MRRNILTSSDIDSSDRHTILSYMGIKSAEVYLLPKSWKTKYRVIKAVITANSDITGILKRIMQD